MVAIDRVIDHRPNFVSSDEIQPMGFKLSHYEVSIVGRSICSFGCFQLPKRESKGGKGADKAMVSLQGFGSKISEFRLLPLCHRHDYTHSI